MDQHYCTQQQPTVKAKERNLGFFNYTKLSPSKIYVTFTRLSKVRFKSLTEKFDTFSDGNFQ